MISCDKTKSLLVSFLSDELGSTESALVLEHLDFCQRCSELASEISNFEIEQPESYSLSLSQAQKEHLDEELLQKLEVEDVVRAYELSDGDVLNFPESPQVLHQKSKKEESEQRWISKEKVLVAALLLSFIWGSYQSYQVEKLHSVIQEQQQSLQLQQQSIKRMESVMQVRPSSPDPYIMTVSHVPRRMDL